MPGRKRKSAVGLNPRPSGLVGKLWIDYVDVELVARWPRNPKKHDGLALQNSVERWGFVSPIIVDETSERLVAGHGRLDEILRAKESGDSMPSGVELGTKDEWLVPVVRGNAFSNESEAEAYLLADNEITRKGGYDFVKLDSMLKRAKTTVRGLGGTGFSPVDADAIRARAKQIAQAAKNKKGVPTDEDESLIPDPPPDPESKLGEVYELGDHRLVCGDSTNPDFVALAFKDFDRPAMIWTDPPYNVAYEGAGGKTIANDSMEDSAFRKFLSDAFNAADTVLPAGAVFFIAHADSEGLNFRLAVRDAGWNHTQTIIWEKDSLVLSRQDYHWRHEPLLYGWKPGAGHHALEDRTQDTIWQFRRPKKSDAHPTMKPPALIERAIRNHTNPNDVVFDFFGGSGSTLIAAARAGRRAVLIELDPGYCDVIRTRWRRISGG